jgi:phytanoyl-CoA dioxygenase PhyH
MLTRAQREEFDARGLLWLRRAVDPVWVAELRSRLYQHLAKRQLVPESPPPGFMVGPSRTTSVVRQLDLAKVWGDSVAGALDELLGPAAPVLLPRWGHVLAITWPQPGQAWVLPHKSWHWDYRAPTAMERMPGLQLFLFVDRIEPRGGGTLFAAGLHRLVDALRKRRASDWQGASRELRRSLASEVPWVRALCSGRPDDDRVARFMERVTVANGVELQVVEAVGEPGDVLAVHPWVMHAPAPNCGTRPRMLFSERVHLRTDAD